MKIKNISKIIIEGIKEPLSNYGFVFKNGKKYFQKIKNGNLQIFDLLFYKDNTAIYLKPEIRLIIKEIEDIYNKVKERTSGYDDRTPTLENNFFEIINYYETGDDKGGKNLNSKYLIENENDIDILIRIILKRFDEYILPYFEANNSVEQIDKLLNENPKDMSIHNYTYPLRAIMGIIAAKLNHNPRFKELISIYEAELKDANPNNKQEFERLKTFLA